jgi:hypothetical protein
VTEVIRGFITSHKKICGGWVWWYTPVILATGEVEIRRIEVQGQARQKLVRLHFNKWAESSGSHQ